MRRIVATLVGSAVLFSAAGCVPQQKYDDMLNAYRAKEQQLHQANSEMETMRSNERMLREQLQRADADVPVSAVAGVSPRRPWQVPHFIS